MDGRTDGRADGWVSEFDTIQVFSCYLPPSVTGSLSCMSSTALLSSQLLTFLYHCCGRAAVIMFALQEQIERKVKRLSLEPLETSGLFSPLAWPTLKVQLQISNHKDPSGPGVNSLV